MTAVFLALATLSSAFGSPDQVRRCLAANDVPCAQQLIVAMEAENASDPRMLALAAEVYFYAGDYPAAHALLSKAVEAGYQDRWQELPLYERTLYTTAGWAEVPEGRFRVRFKPGADAVLIDDAKSVLALSETNLTPLLGAPPPGNTLLEIHPTGRSFIAASSLSKEDVWTTGTVALSKWSRLLITSPRALGRGYGWQSTVAHEYIHLIVAHNTDNRAPVWLQEAIAKYLEDRWYDGADHHQLGIRSQGLLKQALEADDLVTFEEMHPSLAVLPTAERAALAYAQLATLMAFCFQEGGEGVLLRALPLVKDGRDPREALAEASGYKNFKQLEAAWRTHVESLHLENRQLSELPTNLDGGSQMDQDPVMAERDDLARFVRLGDLLRERQRPVAALVEYEKARDPSEPSPLLSNRIAQSMLDLGKVVDARRELETSLSNYPEFTLTHKTLGQIYRHEGRNWEAIAEFDAAAALNPYDPSVQQALADLNEVVGETDAAALHARYVDILRKGGDDVEHVIIHEQTGHFTLPSKGEPKDNLNKLEGRKARSLSMKAVETGEAVRLEDHLGKVVVLDFWATWCGPCIKTIPELEKLQRDHGDRIAVIGVSDEDMPTVKRFLRKKPVDYLITHAPNGDAGSRWGVSSLPTLFVIDRDGIVRKVFIGAGHGAAVEQHVVDLLAQGKDRD